VGRKIRSDLFKNIANTKNTKNIQNVTIAPSGFQF
jgi:hypothetical protein